MKLLASLVLGALLSVQSLSFAETKSTEISIKADSLSAQYNQYYYYNFGQVRVNWSEWADFWLRNTGNGPLYIHSVYVYGTAFRSWSNCPVYLYPGQSCLTRVEFRPWYRGYETGRLRFQFSNGNIFVDLSGWGY